MATLHAALDSQTCESSTDDPTLVSGPITLPPPHMSRSRLLTVILGTALFLVLVLWLVNTLIQLYAGLLPISPVLARVAIGVVVGLIAILLVALIYYARLFLRPRRRSPRPVISTDKPEAAGESLRAVQQQAEQIQDEIIRQAVLERSREMERQLARGALQVVVFGTGSAGKTSIVNAMVGRMVGTVGAAIGTTQTGTTHRFRLQGLEREIWMIDTPGILEAGMQGTEREQHARNLPPARISCLLFWTATCDDRSMNRCAHSQTWASDR
ncbi:MAG: GTPase RsgA [Leptolyngbyaceae cyanobacterium SL_7_1]|nr:GTPase RsgA [Leptolyngbyaceae cyanobacterium SL_7_1]